MFAVYDKNTKKFQYSTDTAPIKERLNQETNQLETICTLPEGYDYVWWTPPDVSIQVKEYVYDEEAQGMRPIMRSADELASIKARQTEAAIKAEKQRQIADIKVMLEKYKEDVEQVELFGMERADYADKKEQCRTMILRLRELEKLVSK